MADGREGLVALDETLAVKFRKMGKNPILVVNKMDEAEKGYSISEFARLGFEQTVAISAEHGLGIDQLLSTIKTGFLRTAILAERVRNPDEDCFHRKAERREIFSMQPSS